MTREYIINAFLGERAKSKVHFIGIILFKKTCLTCLNLNSIHNTNSSMDLKRWKAGIIVHTSQIIYMHKKFS